MKRLFRQSILVFLFLSSGCASTENCPANINLLPMYGGAKKCPEQIKADNEFLKQMDLIDKNRKNSAQDRVDRAWDYFYQNKLDTSMMRFNQAWLLDSTNPDVYWGFGNLLGKKHQFIESIPFFEKSIQLNPGNSKVYESAGLSHGNLFFETKDTAYLNTSISYLKKSVQLDPSNVNAYRLLTISYTYSIHRDSAKKYLKITDSLDPSVIEPEVRKNITGE
jgi:tetratricopeptide (TPR) repeat protein